MSRGLDLGVFALGALSGPGTAGDPLDGLALEELVEDSNAYLHSPDGADEAIAREALDMVHRRIRLASGAPQGDVRPTCNQCAIYIVGLMLREQMYRDVATPELARKHSSSWHAGTAKMISGLAEQLSMVRTLYRLAALVSRGWEAEAAAPPAGTGQPGQDG